MLDCLEVCARPYRAVAASTEEINMLQRNVVRGKPSSSSTRPVENHQIKTANTTGIISSSMVVTVVGALYPCFDDAGAYQTGAMRGCTGNS